MKTYQLIPSRIWLIAIGICAVALIAMALVQPAPTAVHGAPVQSLIPNPSTGALATYYITPSLMSVTGDTTVCGNMIPDPTVASWCNGAPTGTIMVGVDPNSPDPNDWDGGTATGYFYIGGIVSPTVAVLTVSWPDRDGKGLHSPEPYRVGAIALDGRRLWDKRTLDVSTFGNYYAAEHEPILTTLVLTQSITHTISFSVTAHTAWDISQIELALYPYPTTMKGIGYGALRDCQYPGGESQPSTQDIKEDLFRLFHTSNAIRIYSSLGEGRQIITEANAIGLPVFAGAWVDYPTTTIVTDDIEIQALIDAACTAKVEGVIVGNEYYLRHQTQDAINYLHSRISQVKNGMQNCGKNLPVTTAEVDGLMFQWDSPNDWEPEINPNYRPVLSATDFVMVHIYPLWMGLSDNGAAAFTINRYKAIQALIEREYPGQGKRVIIGEAGWPSGGDPRGQAVPSIRNQQRYMLEFLRLAEQEHVDFLYFSAFDGLWKSEEPGGVGRHWGYGYGDRKAKHSFYGVLLPTERLPSPPLPLSHTVYLPHISGGSNTIRKFYVYSEWFETTNHFIPSGWMGDYGNISYYECDRCYPHSGELAIRISLSMTGTLGWAGIYWQDPANNWGTLPGGYTLTGTSRLTFWARGKKGGEVVEFLVGGLGAPDDPYRDSLRPARSTGPIVLSDKWQQYEIDLAGADLSHVIGGFAWVASRSHNSGTITFYLDDIAYEFDPSTQ